MSVKRQTSTMYVTRNGMPTCVEDGLILVTNRAEAQAAGAGMYAVRHSGRKPVYAGSGRRKLV